MDLLSDKDTDGETDNEIAATESIIPKEVEYKERHEDKIYKVIIMVCIMIFLIVLIILLKDNPEIMEKIIYAAGGLIAGGVGGFGYGYKKGNDE